LPQKFRIALPREPQLSRSHARAQFPGAGGIEFLTPHIHLFNQMPRPRHQLIRSTEAQFLLVLDALPEMQHGLQREMESHVFCLLSLVRQSSARQSQQALDGFPKRRRVARFLHQKLIQLGNKRQSFIQSGIAAFLVSPNPHQVFGSRVRRKQPP
jgi:hypothetical protein